MKNRPATARPERWKLATALLAVAVLVGCGSGSTGSDSASAPRAVETPKPIAAAGSALNDTRDWFVDRADASGLRFVYFNGMSGEFYYPEIMPPGVALFDYDNDGDLDVFIVQGQMLGKKTRYSRGWLHHILSHSSLALLFFATFASFAPLR